MSMGYEMSDKKAGKVEKVKAYFDGKGLFYDEKGNGQLVFDGRFNLWSTTEKWHDSLTNMTGVGINSFLKHLTSNNIL